MNAARRGVKFCSVLAALAALAGPAFAGGGTPGIPGQLPDGYLVLPFENESGVVGIDWMRAGLPAALGEKLEAHPGLRAIFGTLILPDGAPPQVIDAAAVAALAHAAGARFVWSGAFARPDWKLQVTVRLWSVEAGSSAAVLVGEKTEKGDFSRSFELLDRCALDLLGKTDRAPAAAAEAAIRRAPTRDYYAYTLYGRGLHELHGLGRAPDLARAEKDLAKSVFIDPKYAEAHRMLAALYEARGQPARARGQRTYALDLKPDYYAPLAGLVRSAYKAKERDEGIELAERALAIRPWDLDVRQMLGEMLWEEGDVDGAHVELKRIVDFKPDYLPARRVLVLVHSAKGHGQELAAELEAVIELDPDDEAARLDLGAAYQALGRDTDAITMYEQVAQQNPKQIQALKFLGDLHKGKGDLRTAIGYYEKAFTANRNDPRPYFLLGAAYVDAGEDRKAIRIYQLAQKFPRYLGETYNNLGSIYYRRKDRNQAMWYLSRAAALRPSSPRVHYNYGLVLAFAKLREQARKELTIASELDPADADIQFELGVAELRLGRLEEAEKAFQEAVRLDPRHEDALHNLKLIDELRRRAREGEIQIE